jgi:hypothetical protein
MVCPACGVVVVAGYARCPKCHAGLPGRIKRTTVDPGGTAVPGRRFPIAMLVALGAGLVILFALGLRGTTKKVVEAPPPPSEPIEAVAIHPPPRPPTEPAVAPPTPAAPVAPAPDLGAAVSDLEDTLHRQRLWGRVEILGPRIDVRSGSCADPAMRPLIDGKKSLLHAAGLTKLRCVEQSGAVVFERDL